MNAKRYILASLTVWVAYMAINFSGHAGILHNAYMGVQEHLRPEEEGMRLLPLHFIGGLIYSFLFCFVFTKGYEEKGIGEGFRYGLWMGLLLILPHAFDNFAVFPFPGSLILGQVLIGLISIVVSGLIVAGIYRGAKVVRG